MCGIIGYHLKDPTFVKTKKERDKLEEFSNKLLLGIESRGTDATGFLAVKGNNSMVLDKKDVAATKFIEQRRELPEGIRTFLGHTRFATQGSPSNWANNHPVFFGSTFITHNGSIRNDDEVFKSEKLTRAAEVDSEAIAAVLSKYGLGDKAAEGIGKLKGGFAVAAVDPIKYPGKVLLFKGESWPLAIYEDKKVVLWGSTAYAVRSAWEKVMESEAPSLKSFRHLLSGDLFTIDGDKTSKTENAFETYSKIGSFGTSTSSWEDSWEDYTGKPVSSYYLPAQQGARFQKTTKKNYKVVDRSEKIKRIRSDGQGQAVVYAQKDSMSKEALEIHDGHWIWCSSCKESVIRMHTIQTIAWGLICTDCFDLANKGDSLYKFSSEVKLELENWAEIETAVHHITLNKAADLTGISNYAIDFLLFRTTQEYVSSQPELEQMFDILTDTYNETYDVVMDEYITRISEEAEEEEKKKKKPDHCMLCSKKAKIYHNEQFRWCTKHYTTCSTRGCNRDTVGCRPNGSRVCHAHFRGTKGGLLDGDKTRWKQTILVPQEV